MKIMLPRQSEKKIYKKASKHDVDIIFNHPDFPLADDIHGLYGMTPPDKLHASYRRLRKYAMETLQDMYGMRKKELLALATLDELHTRSYPSFYLGIVSEIDRDLLYEMVLWMVLWIQQRLSPLNDLETCSIYSVSRTRKREGNCYWLLFIPTSNWLSFKNV